MITLEQIRDLQERVKGLESSLDIAGKRKEVAAKTQETLSPDFWGDPKAAEAFLKKLSGIKSWVNDFDRAAALADDLDVLYEFARDSVSGSEEEMESDETRELASSHAAALKAVEALELRNMLGNEGDNLGAVLTINSGAGGTEANDWSAMLMRMYLRWGERNGFKLTVTDLLEGEEAGIKSCTIEVEGDYAYGYLKAENGVHRLVRISPFNAQGKRQTTFSSVFVYPLVDDTWNGTLSVPAATAGRMSTRWKPACACGTFPRASWSRIPRPVPSRTTARTPSASSNHASTTLSSRNARRNRRSSRARRSASNGVRRSATTSSTPTSSSRTSAQDTTPPTRRAYSTVI